MDNVRRIIALISAPSRRTQLVARFLLGLLGWVAVAAAYPFASDLPRYALY